MPPTECGGVAIVKNSFWRKVALLQNVPTQALPRTSSRMSYPIEGVVKPTILVVDDTPDNLSLMRELLRKDYQVQLANGGERALKLAAMPIACGKTVALPARATPCNASFHQL